MSSEPERRILVLRSALDLCLLTVVARQPVYGYELTTRLAERGLPVAEGSAYPLLARLERAGLLTSQMRTEGARARRYYSITTAGHHALALGRQEWAATAQAVRALLAGAEPATDQAAQPSRPAQPPGSTTSSDQHPLEAPRVH